MKCSICSLPLYRRRNIDRDIVNNRSYAAIARDYDVNYESLRYHAKNHVYAQMAKYQEVQERTRALDVIGEIETLTQRAEKILTEAEEKNHSGLALKAIQQIRGNMALLAGIQNELFKHEIAGIHPAELAEFRAWKESRFDDSDQIDEVIQSYPKYLREALFRYHMENLSGDGTQTPLRTIEPENTHSTPPLGEEYTEDPIDISSPKSDGENVEYTSKILRRPGSENGRGMRRTR